MNRRIIACIQGVLLTTTGVTVCVAVQNPDPEVPDISLKALAAPAQVIVHCEVTEVRGVLENDGRNVNSLVHFKPLLFLKGSQSLLPANRFKIAGGVTDRLIVRDSVTPVFMIGQEYIVFLSNLPGLGVERLGLSGEFRLASTDSYSSFAVGDSADGRVVMPSRSNGLHFATQGRTISGLGTGVVDYPIPLKGFLEQLRQAVPD